MLYSFINTSIQFRHSLFQALSSQIWIGLYSPVGETEWFWTMTGQKATFLNFGENSISDPEKHECACMNLETGIWSRCNCGSSYQFACSRLEFSELLNGIVETWR